MSSEASATRRPMVRPLLLLLTKPTKRKTTQIQVSTIANKAKRQAIYLEQKAQKKKEKKEDRETRKRERDELGDDAPPAKAPKTLDNMREFDETVVAADDEEVAADEANDEFAAYFQGAVTPNVLVTTNRKPVGVCLSILLLVSAGV